MARVPSIA
jgi:hypothetical protein